MKLLVTGGAGYIGSHVTHQLVEEGHSVTVIDDLSSGFKSSLPVEARLFQADIGDLEIVREIMSADKYDAVLHFAANIEVGESMREPLKYYRNNSGKTLSLVALCCSARIPKLIFSSTAAVYGNPTLPAPISESATLHPLSPYGRSKMIAETMIRDLSSASRGPLSFAILRYFNVAGARSDLSNGQMTPNATHLIKTAAQAALGKRDFVSVYGSDYATPDGTCLRDYIHIEDLASAHLQALRFLDNGGSSETFNIGYGNPYSVFEVLDSMKRVSGADFEIRIAPRRAGDPEQLTANNNKARSLLAWKPKFANLDFICETAFKWEKNLNKFDERLASSQSK